MGWKTLGRCYTIRVYWIVRQKKTIAWMLVGGVADSVVP